MDTSAVTLRLLGLDARQTAAKGTSAKSLVQLASLREAARGGVHVPSSLPSEYDPIFRSSTAPAEQDRFQWKEVTRTRPVYETTPIREERDVIGTRDILEERTVYETRDVVETRALYEDQAILVAKVEGSRSLSGYASPTAAGILVGSAATIKVGDGTMATVTFGMGNKITVSKDGVSTNFHYKGDESFLTALANALSSLGTVEAGYTADGRLYLRAAEGLSLTLADGTIRLLANLGLTAGTTNPEVVGHRKVQVGSEDVVVGTEQHAVGTETVVVGKENYVAGTELVTVGWTRKKVGEEQVTGLEMVKAGTDNVAEDDPMIVGLKRSKFFGVSRLLAPGSVERTLPLDYVEILFGPLARATSPSASEDKVRSAYEPPSQQDGALASET